MNKQSKLTKGQQEFLRKLKAGEVQRSRPRTPKETWEENKKSLRNSINMFCWECVCYKKPEVTNCTAVNCPLYQVRPWQRKEER